MNTYTQAQLDLINARYAQAGLPWTLTEPGPPLIQLLPPRVLSAPQPTHASIPMIDERMQRLLNALGYTCGQMKSKHSAWFAGVPVPAHLDAAALMQRGLMESFEDLCGVAAALKEPALRPVFIEHILRVLDGHERSTRLRAALFCLTPVATADDSDLLTRCCVHKSAAAMVAAIRALAHLGLLPALARRGIACHEDHEDLLSATLDVALHLNAEALDHILDDAKDSVKVEVLRLALDALQRLRASPSSPSPPPRRGKPRAPNPQDQARPIAECLLEHFPKCDDEDVLLLMSWCLGMCVKLLGDELIDALLSCVKQGNPSDTKTHLLLNAIARYPGAAETAATIAAEVAALPTNNDADMVLAKARTLAVLHRSPLTAPYAAWLADSIDRLCDLYDPTHAPPPWIAALLQPVTSADPAPLLALLSMVRLEKRGWGDQHLRGLCVAAAVALDPSCAPALARALEHEQSDTSIYAHCAGALLNCPTPVDADPVLLRVALGVSIGGPLSLTPHQLGRLLGLSAHSVWHKKATHLLSTAASHAMPDLVSGFFQGMHQGKRKRKEGDALRAFGTPTPLPSQQVSPLHLMALNHRAISAATLQSALSVTPPAQRPALAAFLWGHCLQSCHLNDSPISLENVHIFIEASRLWLEVPPEELLQGWLSHAYTLSAADRRRGGSVKSLCAILPMIWPRLALAERAQPLVAAALKYVHHPKNVAVHEDIATAARACGLDIPLLGLTDTYRQVVSTITANPRQSAQVLSARLSDRDLLRRFACDGALWRQIEPASLIEVIEDLQRSGYWTLRECGAMLSRFLPANPPPTLRARVQSLDDSFRVDDDSDVQREIASAIAARTSRPTAPPIHNFEDDIEQELDLSLLEALADEPDSAAGEEAASPRLPVPPPPPPPPPLPPPGPARVQLLRKKLNRGG